MPGRHNIYNALAATAAAICLGIKPTAVTYGLAGFNGAGRRLEFKGKFNGADVYDDYAHHPGELKALLDAVEPLGYKRTIVVFQPHTYSRTIALFDDFLRQLSRPDVVYLAEIYAAREKNTQGVSSAMALITQPKVLFLDEPTLGLDVLARRELWREIEKLRGKMTVVLTTHYLEEAEALSDRIGILVSGRLTAVGTAEELKKRAGKANFEDAFVALATGGTEA